MVQKDEGLTHKFKRTKEVGSPNDAGILAGVYVSMYTDHWLENWIGYDGV
jgi:hypothetical protein